MSSRLSAVILAAGYSSRMGRLKPLLRLGGQTLLEMATGLFSQAGVRDIVVVTGHSAEDLRPLAQSAGAVCVDNPDFDRGMFSSVATGVKSLPPETEAFFILPVDIPLVRPETVRRLVVIRDDNRDRIIHPCFLAERGHPPLIPASLRDEIIAWDSPGGLKALLDGHADRCLDVEVPDRNILFDVDTPDDYQELAVRWQNRLIPAAEECEAILTRIHPVEPAVLAHSRAVASAAVAMGRACNQAGAGLNLDLILAGALLHDLAKGRPDHARAGAEMLREYSWPEVAMIVGAHIDLPVSEDEPVTEAEVVHLADKVVRGVSLVSLEKRFAPVMERYAGDPEASKAITRRLNLARIMARRFERMAGRSIGEILIEAGLEGENGAD